MKLSERLRAIDSLITREYEHIWGCCCDHGQLGMALASRKAASYIHFVDCVPSIIQTLDQKLAKRFDQVTDRDNYSICRTHLLDIIDLPMDSIDMNTDQLVVIAGVGSELTLSFVEHLNRKFLNSRLTFLLCPVRDQYRLREGLQRLNFSVLNEQLIKENNRFYEVILIRQTKSEAKHLEQNCHHIAQGVISTTGTLLWQYSNRHEKAILEEYLSITIGHYQRISLGTDPFSNRSKAVEKIIKDYQDVQSRL